MDYLIVDLEQAQQRILDLERVIRERCGENKQAHLLCSMPGISYFTATSLVCCVGRVERFPRACSLANYWGLTPGCRNSGENNQRLGRITKAGSQLARWLLAQVTLQVLRKDGALREWHKRLKRRRGSSSDAEAGDDYLADAESSADVCGMPSRGLGGVIQTSREVNISYQSH